MKIMSHQIKNINKDMTQKLLKKKKQDTHNGSSKGEKDQMNIEET